MEGKGREGKGRDGRTSKKKFPLSNKAKQIAGRRVIKGMYGKREEIDQKKDVCRKPPSSQDQMGCGRVSE